MNTERNNNESSDLKQSQNDDDMGSTPCKVFESHRWQ